MIQTYRTAHTTWLFPFCVALFAFTGVGVWMLRQDISPWFDVLWFSVIAFLWWRLLFRSTYEVRVSDQGICEFRSMLGSKQLRAHAVISVTLELLHDEDGDPYHQIIIRHQDGKVALADFPGSTTFARQLKAANPAIELVGFRSTALHHSSLVPPGADLRRVREMEPLLTKLADLEADHRRISRTADRRRRPLR